MKVKGNEGEYITLKEASIRQEKHLKHRKDVLKESDPIKSQFFGKEKLLALLSKPNCKGLKIIYGQDGNSLPSLVLAAADEDLNVLGVDKTGLKDGEPGDYLAGGPICPRDCAQ